MCKYNFPTEKAVSLTTKFGTSNPIEIASYLNIGIFEAELVSILGYFCLVHDHPIIIIKKGLDSPIKNFVVAHELGHAILHLGFMNDKDFFDEASHLTNYDSMQTELEANIFAANLIISDSELLEAITEHNEVRHIAYALNTIPEAVLIKAKYTDNPALRHNAIINPNFFDQYRSFDV